MTLENGKLELTAEYEMAYAQGVSHAKQVPGLSQSQQVRSAFNWYEDAVERGVSLDMNVTIRGYTAGYQDYERGIV